MSSAKVAAILSLCLNVLSQSPICDFMWLGIFTAVLASHGIAFA